MRNQAVRASGYDFNDPQGRFLEAVTGIYQDIDVDKELVWQSEVTTLQKLTKLLCKTYLLNMSNAACNCVVENLDKNSSVLDYDSFKKNFDLIMRGQMCAINLQFSNRYENLKGGNHWSISVVLDVFKEKYRGCRR